MPQPAARLTDMHVCPMQTPAVPPIPHVGGPISGPGCPTVLIGGLPAAGIGDMAVCVGPPDTVAMGSPTRSGLDSEDTVGSFRDASGKAHTVASNRVAVYAPRFGSVRTTTGLADRKSTRLNSSHVSESRMPSSA